MTRPPMIGFAIAIACIGVGSPAAMAQMESREGIALENQILELRHELDQLRGQGVPAGETYAPPPVTGSAGGDLTPQLLGRITRLEDEVRQLRGRIDEQDNAHQQAEANLTKQLGDLEFRLGNGGSPGALSPTRPDLTLSPPPGNLGQTLTAPRPPQAPGVPPLAQRTPEVALREGDAALARHDYAAAEAAARELLASGHGPRTTDAQFLLAQSLAGQRNYQAAAVAYDDAYNRNARGLRAPDSLLGMANSLNALGDKRAACQTLDKLRAEFPAPRPELREPIAAARTRASCR